MVVFTSSSVFTSSLSQTSDENTDICPHGSRKTARSIESSVLPRGGNECMVDESCVPITHRQSGKRKQLLVPVPGGSRRRQFVGAPIPSCRCTCTTCRAAVWSRTHTSRGQARVMAPRGTGLLLRLTRRARAAPGSSRVGSAARVRARFRTARHGPGGPPTSSPLCAVGADTDKDGTAWARGHTSPARRTGAIRAVRFFPKKKN